VPDLTDLEPVDLVEVPPDITDVDPTVGWPTECGGGEEQ
jgi:hypothetical protein